MSGHGTTHGALGAYEPVFAGAGRDELDGIVKRYPAKAGALLPALWMIQNRYGWVPPEGVEEVAAALELTPAYVRGVLTFYTMYHQHPAAKYFIQVCTTSPCNACGAEDVVKAFLQHTGCEDLGLKSVDGKYSVIEVECLGACGFATPVMINEEFLESVTPERVPAILAQHK
jgi:NADH:ubiquinone oxidoreductase subunit E